MAKIPRIETGDRPSAAYTPTMDDSVSKMAGAIGDLSAQALATATAEEQAERQRLAEALALKKKIVDESNAGRVALEFEDTNFKTLAQLEKDYADNPEQIPQKYTEIMREQANAINDRQDVNDTVKLDAVKSAESTMSSGLRQAYSITSRLQTEQVKGNIAKAKNYFGNSAIGLGSPDAVLLLAEKFKGTQRANFVAAFGKNADVELQAATEDAFYAWGKNFTDTHPGEYLAMDSKILKGNLSVSRYAELRQDAEASLKGITRRSLNQTYIEAVRRGSVVTKSYAEGTLDAASILSMRAGWQAKVDAISIDPNLTPVQRAEQIRPITRELEVLGIVENMHRTELKADNIPDDELPGEITAERQRLFGKDKGKIKAKSLDELLEYKKKLVLAHAKKSISPGDFRTLVKEVDLRMEKSVSKERNNTTSLITPDNPKEIGNDKVKDLFSRKKPKATDQERNRVTLKFIELFNAAEEANRPPTELEAARLAEDAFYITYGLPPKEGK